MRLLPAVYILVLAQQLCFIQGILLRKISCFTWEVKVKELILTCSVEDSEKIMMILNPQLKLEVSCENFKCTKINTQGSIQSIGPDGMTYVLPLDDNINGRWSCIYGSGQLSTTVSSNEGIQAAPEIIIDGRMSKSQVYTTANTCLVPYGKNAEILINGVQIDGLKYYSKEKTCFHGNESPCLPGICNCSRDGKSFAYVFQLDEPSKFTNLSYRMKFKVGDKRLFINAFCSSKDESCLKREVNSASTSVPKMKTTEMMPKSAESKQDQLIAIIVFGCLLVVIASAAFFASARNSRSRTNNVLLNNEDGIVEEPLVIDDVEDHSGQKVKEMAARKSRSRSNNGPVNNEEDVLDEPLVKDVEDDSGQKDKEMAGNMAQLTTADITDSLPSFSSSVMPKHFSLDTVLFIYACAKVGNLIIMLTNDGQLGQKLVTYNNNTDKYSDICFFKDNEDKKLLVVNKNIVAIFCPKKYSLDLCNLEPGMKFARTKLGEKFVAISSFNNNLYLAADGVLKCLSANCEFYEIATKKLQLSGLDDIEVNENKLVCICRDTIYCFDLNCTLLWSQNFEMASLPLTVLSDGKGFIYVAESAHKVTVIQLLNKANKKDLILSIPPNMARIGIMLDNINDELCVYGLSDERRCVQTHRIVYHKSDF